LRTSSASSEYSTDQAAKSCTTKERIMPVEILGDYEIEYSAVQLADGAGWTAHAAVFGPSPNPMHRNIIFPDQRVAVETVFPTQIAAESEALKIAKVMITQ
jgi:hypothetical protein